MNLEENKNRIITLISELENSGRSGNFSLLRKQLEGSDFYTAPASTTFLNIKGGLVEYSLRIFDSLEKLNASFELGLSRESIIICSLFCNLSSINTYKLGVRNKKVYSCDGSKSDNLGRFDWISSEIFETRDIEDRFIFANRETTSAFMINTFIPLSTEEWVAILHSKGGKSFDSAQDNVLEVFSRFPLVKFLHIANLISM